ncbi:peptidylprolyl isomerase [soil metagenome]
MIRILALAGVSLALLAGCSRSPILNEKPEAGDKPAAKIGNETVWVSDVRRAAVAEGVVGEGEPLDVGSEPFRRVLDEVIDQKLLAREAQGRRLDRDAVVRRKLAAARDKVMGDALIEAEVDKAVNEGAIRQLYAEQQKKQKGGEEYHARQIILPTQADAEAVKKLLFAGGAFEALAMQRSTDQTTRFSGGDLGWFTPDSMPESYGAALKAATPGQVLGPFQTDSGWVVVRLEERRPETPISMEEARPQIVRFLTYDQIRVLLSGLRARTKVQVLTPPAAPTSGREPASAPAKP